MSKPRPMVDVTKDDIKHGVRRNMGSCPIALAIRRLANGEKVSVAGWIAIGACRYEMPDRAGRFVDRFDDGKPVKPFRFRLPKAEKHGGYLP